MTCGKCNCEPGACKCSSQSCACGGSDCKCGSSSGNVHKISCDELKAKIDSSEDILVVNVLDSEHYNDCHIAGTMHVPLAELEKECAGWDKDKKIVVYCANTMCSASKEAAKLLSSLGFTKVCAFEGGTKEWKEKGLPCEGACEMDYLG